MSLLDLLSEATYNSVNGVIATYGFGVPVGGGSGGVSPKGPNSFDPGAPLPSEHNKAIAKTRSTRPGENRLRMQSIAQQNRFKRLRMLSRGYPAAANSVDQLNRSVRNSKLEVVLKDEKATPTPEDLIAIEAVRRFFCDEEVDKRNGWHLKEWLSVGERDIEEVGVFAFAPWYNEDSTLNSLYVIDPATLIPQKGLYGNIRHGEGEPSYTQELNGRAWWTFTAKELFYCAPNPLSDEIYGRGPTDSAIEELSTAVLESISGRDLAENHGHLTVFLSGFENQDVDSREEVARAVEIDVNKRLRPGDGIINIVALNHDAKIEPLPRFTFTIDREEFRVRLIRQAYGLSPTANVRDNNRGTSETQGDVEESTIVDRHEWWGAILSRVVRNVMFFQQLTVRLVPRMVKDELAVAQANATALGAGYKDVDEVRRADGLSDNAALQAAFMAGRVAPKPVSPFGAPAPVSGPIVPSTDEPATDEPEAETDAPTFNELTLSVERFTALGDGVLVNTLRDAIAERLGVAAPAPIDVLAKAAEGAAAVEPPPVPIGSKAAAPTLDEVLAKLAILRRDALVSEGVKKLAEKKGEK